MTYTLFEYAKDNKEQFMENHHPVNSTVSVWCAGFRVLVVCEEMMIRRLEGKGVNLEASFKGSSGIILGMGKGVMATYYLRAASKIKKFLEI